MMKFVILLTVGAAAVNPVQKVLSLLEDLQKKVLLDGEVEQKQYEKFTEWCEDEARSTQYAIKDGKAKAEGLKAVIEKTSAEIMNADATIGELAKKVTRNQKDLQAATEIRAKEAGDFAVADADLAETVDMLGRAAGILARSMKGGSLAQVSQQSASALTDALSVVMKASIFSTKDKSKLQALVQDSTDDDFLSKSAPAAAAYENHSGGIVDTLEDMKDKASSMRNDAQKDEMNAKHSFEMLEQSLKNEIAVDEKELNGAKATKAANAEEKAAAEGNLSMTETAVAEAQKALQGLAADCQQKAADWEVSQKSRAEELEALTQARKIIAEKTGGAEGRAYDLLELSSGSRSTSVVSGKVVDSLKKLGRGNGDVAMTQLALRVQATMDMNAGPDVFGKVRGMISEMIDKLVNEAAEEASHKAWCDKEMGDSRAKIEDKSGRVDKLSTKIDKDAAQIAQLTDSIAQLQSDLAELSKQQAAMDSMRADEKAAYGQAHKDYTDGVEGLTMALQLLRDYYAAGDASLLQQPSVSVHAKSGDAATGIIGLLEVAQSDFSKLLADAEVEEETAQEAYEKVSQENAVSKAMKGADVKYQTKEKAGLEKTVAEHKEDRESEQAELDAVQEYLDKVAPGCTVKPMTYEERKQRRENEISGLKEALTILEAETPTAFLALRTARRS